MNLKKPLVLYNGHIAQLQPGDTLDAPVAHVNVITMLNYDDEMLYEGQPVYSTAAGSGVKRAIANASITSEVLGLVVEKILPLHEGDIQTDGFISVNNWSPVIGSPELTPGAEYYLAPEIPGMMTAAPPEFHGQYLVYIGRAISTTTLEISIERPIKL